MYPPLHGMAVSTLPPPKQKKNVLYTPSLVSLAIESSNFHSFTTQHMLFHGTIDLARVYVYPFGNTCFNSQQAGQLCWNMWCGIRSLPVLKGLDMHMVFCIRSCGLIHFVGGGRRGKYGARFFFIYGSVMVLRIWI